jgi:hypothetical protein
VLTNTPVPRLEETLSREPWRSKFVDVLTMLRDRYRKRFEAPELETEMEKLTIALLDCQHNSHCRSGANLRVPSSLL